MNVVFLQMGGTESLLKVVTELSVITLPVDDFGKCMKSAVRMKLNKIDSGA